MPYIFFYPAQPAHGTDAHPGSVVSPMGLIVMVRAVDHTGYSSIFLFGASKGIDVHGPGLWYGMLKGCSCAPKRLDL